MSSPLLAVFLAEARTIRRLARTWLILLLAGATTFIGYVFFTNLHQQASAALPSATTSPHLMIASFGGYLLWFLLGATVFLGFDVGNRERRERIAEVFDARPLSNPQLLMGRLLGVVAVLIVALLLAILVLQGFGVLMAVVADWPLAPVFQATSLAVFLFVDAIPVLVFWTACVYLLAALLRHRLLVAMAAFALLGLWFWGLSHAPEWLLGYLKPAPDRLVSDLVSGLPDGVTILMRTALLWLAAGLVGLAAIALPRPDTDRRASRLHLTAALLVVGILSVWAALNHAHRPLTDRERWAAAEREARQSDPRAFALGRISGAIDIDPGSRLTLDLELTLAMTERPGSLLFHFNPGLAIEQLHLNGERASFDHEAGILRIDAPAEGGEALLAIQATGVPQGGFAYLDSAIDFRRVVGRNPLRGLGTEGSLFDRRYVALMPGAHWLPAPVIAVADGEPATPAAQFRMVDLAVRVPPGWLVAGPGKREALEAGLFRFRPDVPVAEVGLFASRFVSYATQIHGVEAELLVSRAHAMTLSVFEDSANEIAAAAAEVLADMDARGIGYPYDALSLVEIPASLRSYGGGWRMPSVLAAPGVLMLRERGFPTARFTVPDPPPDDLAEEQVESLGDYFQRERTGGNLFAGLAHHGFLGRTGAAGPGAHALEFVCHDLAARILGHDGGHFSAHVYAESASVPQLLADSIASFITGGSGRASGELFAGARTPAVWERAVGAALVDLDLDNPAQAVNVLTLKGEAVGRSILDALGRETTARLLAELRARFDGRLFTAADFVRVSTDIDMDLPALVGDWLHDAALPGFLASPVATARLADDVEGRPRYQTRVHVYNGEGAPGLFRLRYRIDQGDAPVRSSDPVRVGPLEAVEVGVVTQAPLRELWVAPYLSLNRQEFPLRVPETDSDQARDDPPLVGARESVWRPSPPAGIVIDDLDPGFSVHPGFSDLRRERVDLDEGLPVYQRLDHVLESHWSRAEQPTSWGWYRKTVARVTPGDGNREAVFTARLPASGRWRLDYHLPNLDVGFTTRSRSLFQLTAEIEITSGRQTPGLGDYDLRLVDADDNARGIDFDASAAEPGWNTLGNFELDAGEVRLVVTNRTTGATVVADAIRWTQVNP
ncbi:MAG: hypothetical protein F4X98_15360 [Gammaproteobacteria bacterium]|nr:hypothetical protein [Gammaproteobacteria bacterium]